MIIYGRTHCVTPLCSLPSLFLTHLKTSSNPDHSRWLQDPEPGQKFDFANVKSEVVNRLTGEIADVVLQSVHRTIADSFLLLFFLKEGGNPIQHLPCKRVRVPIIRGLG